MNKVETPVKNTAARAGSGRPGNAGRTPAAKAPLPRGTPVELCVGVVTAAAPDGGADESPARFEVQSGRLRMSARVAASCLLQPGQGDTVSCLRAAPDELWITAVLMREAGVPQVLLCDGPTRLKVRGGDLRIEADALGLRSSAFTLDAQTASVVVQQADVAGRELRVAASALKLVGTALSSVFERVQHFSHQYLRTTQGIDRVSADHVECEARQLLRLSGDHVIANGRKLVKARGGQIHLG